MIVKPETPCFTDYQSNTLFRYDGLTSDIERLSNESLDFAAHKSVQILDDLFSISEKPLVVWRYAGVKTAMA